jgi:hypothetical protein
MAKQQQNDENLFGGIDFGAIETDLIVVDTPVKKEIEEIQDDNENPDGSGEPSKKEHEKKPEDKKVEKKKDDLIIVDTEEKEEEVIEDKNKKPAEDTKGGGTPNKDENYSPVYLHAAALQENGVLPNFELDSIKDLEPKDAILKINEHIQNQIVEASKEKIEEFKSKYEEPTIKFMEALEKGVSFEDIAENYTLEARYNSVTEKVLEEDEDLQESIYKDYLSLKGFSDSKIKKMIDTAKEKDELLVESRDGLVEIKQQIKVERDMIAENAEKEKKAREARNIEMKESIHKNVTATKEVIPGIELSEAEKKEIIKMMTVPVKFVKQNGQDIPVSAAMELRMKDPVAYEMKLNYFIKNGFFDANGKFDILLKKSESKATQKLIEKMNGEKKDFGKTGVKAKAESQKEGYEFLFPHL